MRRRAPRHMRLVQSVSFAVVLIGCLFVLLRRADPGEGEAFAAPRGPSVPGVAVADAGAAAADASAAETGATAEIDPIELAIAPDGGVPYHPSGTDYRSPFAKPNPGPVVRVKVGMLLNSVDDYDVKTGTFLADFFLSMTSALPMPPLNIQFPNGKVDSKETIADRTTRSSRSCQPRATSRAPTS